MQAIAIHSGKSKFSLNAGSIGDNVVNGQFLLWLGDTAVLPIVFPKIYEQSRESRPEFILLQMHLANAVIGKPGIIIKLISALISSFVSSLIRISKKIVLVKKPRCFCNAAQIQSIYIKDWGA